MGGGKTREFTKGGEAWTDSYAGDAGAHEGVEVEDYTRYTRAHMGIRNLMQLVRKKHGAAAFLTATAAIRRVLRGTHVAVDAANHVHRLAHAAGSNQVPALTSSMHRFVYTLQSTYDVDGVILVLDGPSAAMKQCEKDRRTRARRVNADRLVAKQEALARLEADAGASAVEELGIPLVDRIAKNAGMLGSNALGAADNVGAASAVFSSTFTFLDTGEDAATSRRRMHAATVSTLRANIERDMARQSVVVTRDLVQRVCEGVARLEPKVTTVQAPGDGEMLCAALAAHGEVGAVVSNDSDVIPLGVEWTLRFTGAGAHLLDLAALRDSMGVTQEELRVACVLAGSDFSPHIRGLGIATALRLVRRWGASVPAVLRAMPKVEPVKHYVGPAAVATSRVIPSDGSCPKCAQPPRNGEEVRVHQCSHCGSAVCGRPQCWTDHERACFRGTVGMAMVEADAMFAAAATVHAEEELLADALVHGDPVWDMEKVGPEDEDEEM